MGVGQPRGAVGEDVVVQVAGQGLGRDGALPQLVHPVGHQVEVGLDNPAVQRVLDGDEYGEDVRADEAQAHSYGISGVPFFVVDDRYGISGAQPTELFTEALHRAWDDAHPQLQALSATGGSAPGCEGDACDV